MRSNPQLSAIALLVRKYGRKIPGGGYEVEVSHTEMKEMSPHGMFKEVSVEPNVVKWQYFPNPTIEAVGGITPDSVTPEGGIDPAYLQEKMTDEQKKTAETDDGCTT